MMIAMSVLVSIIGTPSKFNNIKPFSFKVASSFEVV